MAEDWRDYQQQAAQFFRGLGLDARTDMTIAGVRTCHAIDVLVTLRQAGFNAQWIVECKAWQSRVSKLHVLALREIVADTGADRDILLAEAGFQSGAAETASLTNVRISSLGALRESASAEIYAIRIRELIDRTELRKERYWDLPKEWRIEYGVRDLMPGYSGARAVEACDAC